MNNSEYIKITNQVIDEELAQLRKEKRRRDTIAYLAPIIFVCLMTVSLVIYLTYFVS